MLSVEELQILFEKAQALDKAAVDLLFDELWHTLNHLPVGMLDTLLSGINIWAETQVKLSPRFTALSRFTLGYNCFFAAKYSQSAAYCHSAIELFSEIQDEDGVAITSVVLGNSYRSLGSNELAMQCYLRASQRQNGAYILTDLGSSYQLAEVYVDIGNYEEALQMFRRALEISSHKQIARWWQPRIINSIALTLSKLGNTANALTAFKKALAISRRNSFDAVTARILTDLADHFYTTGNLARATLYNNKALRIREERGLHNAGITNFLNLAGIAVEEKQYGQALQYLQQGLAYATALGMKSKQARAHEIFSIVFEQAGDLQQSLEHYKTYHRLKEESSMEDAERKLKNYKQAAEADRVGRENTLIRQQKAEIEIKNTELQVTIRELIMARDQIRLEKERSDELLLNILPEEIAAELKEQGSAQAKQFDNVTILFTDFKNFTLTAERLLPQELVAELHACFSMFDQVMAKYNIEKIKTVGDAYLAACGLPAANADHANNIVFAALEIRDFMLQRKQILGGHTFDIRIGIHSGNVVAGIVGVKKFAYDIWGDTVNTAARMEQHGEPGRVNISAATYQLVRHQFVCTPRGRISAKNKGEMEMYFVNGII